MNEGASWALLTFGIYTAAVFVLAVLSNRAAKSKQEFVSEYFLGSRSFGIWAFALTFAATNSSGGSFMGFPALIYTHGWTLALWIAGFMLSPLVAMGLLGKRLNQVARKCNALTIPEVLGGRFESRAVGLTATVLLIFFMFFYLMANFKAGGEILSTLLADEPIYRSAVAKVEALASGIPWVSSADPNYLVCLLVFSIAVIVYVVYGGFRAVVWTDVMQGIVMFLGVILMLGLALWQVGGLSNATRKLAEMTPPELGTAIVECAEPADSDIVFPKGAWIKQDGQTYRLGQQATINRSSTRSEPIKVLRLTSGAEAVLPDELPIAVRLQDCELEPYQYGAASKGVYVTNPGPSNSSSLGFLALGTAISFFIFWPFSGAGQPGNMVRLMSFKDTRTLRYSIVTVGFYYAVIYFSLVVICCCGRVLLPGMEVHPDRTMPELATKLTENAGVPWLAGLLVAAPFAAVMSSVDSFLLMVSSGVVRDVYQGHVRPDASQSTLKRLSYLVTVAVGILAFLFVLNPPEYLQDLIVFASGGLGACFFMPMVLALYWRRMTAAATVAGMIAGTLTHVGLTAWGYYERGRFEAYGFLGLNPFIWDLLVATIACVLVAKLTKVDEKLVRRFFYR